MQDGNDASLVARDVRDESAGPCHARNDRLRSLTANAACPLCSSMLCSDRTVVRWKSSIHEVCTAGALRRPVAHVNSFLAEGHRVTDFTFLQLQHSQHFAPGQPGPSPASVGFAAAAAAAVAASARSSSGICATLSCEAHACHRADTRTHAKAETTNSAENFSCGAGPMSPGPQHTSASIGYCQPPIALLVLASDLHNFCTRNS